MSWMDAWRHRLGNLLHRRRFEADLEMEMDFHRQMETNEQLNGGMAKEEAAYAASRRIGSTAWYKDEVRRMAGLDRLDSWTQDIRFAFRGIRREPFFAAFIVLTLALGIGANAAIFAVVDRLMLRGPDHVVSPQEVVRFYQAEKPHERPEYTTSFLGYAGYMAIAEGTPSLTGAAAYSTGQQTTGAGGDARPIDVSYVTASFFPLLGVVPERGRFFTSREDTTTGAEHVAVISHGFWQNARGSDPAILGKQIEVRSQQFTIIGVAPKGFTGAELTPVDVWLPMSTLGPRVTAGWTTSWNAQWLNVIGRVRTGVSHDQVESQSSAAYVRAFTEADTTSRFRITVAPLSANEEGKASAEASVSRWLVGVTALVLLIACANVINLLLARAMRRQREVAVRLTLGAGRMRLVRLFLIEGLVITTLATMIGLGFAWMMMRLIRGVFLPDIAWNATPIDVRVLTVTSTIAIAVGLLVGIVPAFRLGHSSLSDALKSGIREGGGRRARGRQLLTVAQTAISVVLLIGAGLFVQSLRNIHNLDLGIETDRVLVMSVNWPSRQDMSEAERVADRAREDDFYREGLERVGRLPEVEHASLAVGLPFRTVFGVQLRVPGWDSVPRVAGGRPNISAVTAEYFETVGTPLLRGRRFTEADRKGSEPVTIVSNLMAKTLWPHADALNQCLYIGGDSVPCSRVVGIVGDAHRDALREAETMHYYIPMGQEDGFGGTTLLIRPRGNPEKIVSQLRSVLQEGHPQLGYINAQTMQQIVDPQVRPWRLGATVFTLAGVLALLVAAVGLYSILSYLIAQRRHEIGVRMALGAQSSNITMLVLRSSLTMVLAGIFLGTAAALAGGRFVEGLLFDTSARDMGAILTGGGTLLLVAIAASLVPVVRANRVHPMEALRAE